ncbi:radical SAM protein [Desulfovibrio sp. OttesenSCG-928-M14]|nr:radical SAM protein [Desulfovibrio sp. OttesenSCG-928-M14]
MKLTKDCVWPWTYVLVHAGGLMQTCPCASDIEIGDFILDVCEAEKRGKTDDIFSGPALQSIRDGLLTGNLRPMCRDCAFAPPGLIATAELEAKVVALLRERHNRASFSQAELRSMYAYDRACFSLTNRCNLRCIYCNQSTCADTNPYYKADYPKEFVYGSLKRLADLGITKMHCSTEGEATISPIWYEAFSWFHKKYHEIELYLTTNLNRSYSDHEINFLAHHAYLELSCDTLDETIYKKIRVNSRLSLVLKNLLLIKKKADDLAIPGQEILIHVVLCNLTWATLEALAEFAFANGLGLNIGNYEERGNAIGCQQGILKPVETLSRAEQKEITCILKKIQEKSKKLGLPLYMWGDILGRVSKNVEADYNRFTPFDDNPFIAAYYALFPKGTQAHHLDVIYDADNISHFGIMAQKPLELAGIKDCTTAVCREWYLYKKGSFSSKPSDYGKSVVPGYRRKDPIVGGAFLWRPEFKNSDIDSVFLELTDWWKD